MDDDGLCCGVANDHAYLADKTQSCRLVSHEPKTRARIEQYGSIGTRRLGQEAGKIMYNTHFAGDKRNDKAIEDAKKWLEKILPVLDDELKQHSYLGDDQPNLADIAVATNMAYLDMCQYDLKPYPAVARWYDSMKKRPSFAKTVPK